MTNAEALWASLTPSGEHLLDNAGPDVDTTRRMLWQLEVGPIPLSSSVVATCGEAKCVNPNHAKVTEPRSAGETKNSVRVNREMQPYYEAVRDISCARGYPDDIWMFAGFAAGLMFLARAETKFRFYRYGTREHREYVRGVQAYRKLLESREELTGVSVDEALALAHARNPNLRSETPVINPPKQPDQDRLTQVVLSPDVVELMKKGRN